MHKVKPYGFTCPLPHMGIHTHERGQVGTPRKSTQFSTKIALTRRLPSAPSLRLLCAHNVCVVVPEHQPVTSVHPLMPLCATMHACVYAHTQPTHGVEVLLLIPLWGIKNFSLLPLGSKIFASTARIGDPNFAPSTSTNRRRRVSAKSKFSTSWQNQQKHPQT